jgi:predicted nucleic-acid-binding Zn-ribbon protein
MLETVGYYHCEKCEHGRMHLVQWSHEAYMFEHICNLCGHTQFYDKTYMSAWIDFNGS